MPSWIIEEAGSYRPMSVAFIDRRSGEVSVAVADMTSQDAFLNGYTGQSIAEFAAGVPRSASCIVAATPENPDPAHRVICHTTTSGMKKAAKLIANAAAWAKLELPPLS